MNSRLALILALLAPAVQAETLFLDIDLSLPGESPMHLQTHAPANRWSEHPMGDYRLALQPSTDSDGGETQITIDAVLTRGEGERLNQLLMPVLTLKDGERGAMELGEPPRMLSFSVEARFSD